MISCPACGGQNEQGRKFCGECGTPLSLRCPACSASNAATAKFCGECGSPLASATPAEERVAERRLVSVLFADLVGFTTASEARDAEDTRELLTRYFELARTTIERYGGTVEKFIGDAVMAVWGAPVAQEDDAERAVRAALDLLGAIPELDPALRARAGVLTGEAAVTIGAEGQGMVAGDLVNTASRIQSAAEPGTVLVGDSTRRATEAAIAYEDAGDHELKGKAERVALSRALRVVAGKGGSMRSAGLEAPFVGRARELRLVKELFHASAEEQRAQLVLVSGIAGIGKSRLAWEFEKYIDGLAADVFWHRGRCLSYGEGVAYWALAEMVRMRCGIAEEEEAPAAREKLRVAIGEYIPDVQEREWVEPRLAHLLGLEDGGPGDQENLFSAWRILFERLAEQSPTVLVFEDVQWADAGLLDFLEYLLDWSRSHPLFVVALARPEFAEKRSAWAGKRGFTQLYLEPLSAQAMTELLAGLVPEMPDDLRERILQRAEGVPLYAVETIRMLLDRGMLEREGNAHRLTGAVETLEVPETLQALVAARLDGLSVEERRLVQDGAVLGKTFTKHGLAALTGLADAELEPLLASLLRKEVLSVQADPRSPERGQYAFLQDIVKRIAYETLSKRERKAKHLAAAEFLSGAWGAEEDEIVEVVAAHYRDAYETAPDAEDAAEIRGRASAMLVRAAERAASLGANAEAQHAFEEAIELADELLERADLHERAGIMARTGARTLEGAAHYERAIELFESEEMTHPAARVKARLAETLWDTGRLEEGLESMDRSFQALATEEPDADLAALAAQLGRFLFFAGRHELAMERIEAALALSEALWLPETFSSALNTKGVVLMAHGRPREALGLLRHSLEVALDNDKPSAALRAYFNLADVLSNLDRYEEAEATVREALDFARRVGNRFWELLLLGQTYPLFALGKWGELKSMLDQLPEEWVAARQAFGTVTSVGVISSVHRGQLDEAERIVARFAEFAESADTQEAASHGCGMSCLLLGRGDAAGALALAETVLEARHEMGITQEYVKEALVVAMTAAVQLGDVAKLDGLIGIVDSVPGGRLPQFHQAQAMRFRAQLARLTGDPDAERLFKRAAGLFRELAIPFYLATTELEHAEWLVSEGRADEAERLLAGARETFERLDARPWRKRVDAVHTGEGVVA